jgi:hypothetical protein
MAFEKGDPKPEGSGRQSRTPNRITREVKEMVLAALDRAGGEDYLLAQAHDNPKAFLSLLGRIIPTQVTGKDGKDLIPDRASDPDRVAQALLLLLATPTPEKPGEV